MSEKTVKIVLCDIKEPDTFGELCYKLKLSEKDRDKFFSFCEYANLELVVSKDMTFTGRFIPNDEGPIQDED